MVMIMVERKREEGGNEWKEKGIEVSTFSLKLRLSLPNFNQNFASR
ncbi:unnamed protein product, partial [Linum tenue]